MYPGSEEEIKYVESLLKKYKKKKIDIDEI
jgi:hypothetical protein